MRAHTHTHTHTHPININGGSLSTVENQALGTDHNECFTGLMNREILAIRIRKVII